MSSMLGNECAYGTAYAIQAMLLRNARQVPRPCNPDLWTDCNAQQSMHAMLTQDTAVPAVCQQYLSRSFKAFRETSKMSLVKVLVQNKPTHVT